MNLAETSQNLQQILNQEILLHRMTNRIRESLDLQEILAATVTEVRSLLNTDRVMVYRFDTDGSGEVIAESIHNNRLPSVLGLNFPADDIPQQARDLYLKARLRSIVDVSSQAIGLSPAENTNLLPIPVNDIRYRPVDACHVSYLKAMGVQSSLVVPILHDNRLWGLLVSHHSEPHFIFEQDLQLVQQVADQVSVAIAHSTMLQVARSQQAREATINRIATLLHARPTIELQAALEATTSALKGSGGRLYIHSPSSADSQLFSCGTGPFLLQGFEHPLIEKHPLWLQSLYLDLSTQVSTNNHPENPDYLAVTDLYKHPQLQSLATPAFSQTKIRGILVLPLHYRHNFLGYLTIFRDEIETEKLWAGRFDTNSKQQRPRQSFQAWRERKKGQSCPWTSDDIELGRALANHFSMALQQYLLYREVQQLNTTLEQQVKERTAQLQQSLEFTRSLKQITDQIRSTLDLKTILQTITREVRCLLKTDRVIIYQMTPEGTGEVTVEDQDGNWLSILNLKTASECFPSDYIPLYLAGRIRAINNVVTEDISPCQREFLESLQIKANLIVPITIESQLWGLLIAHSCQAPRIWQPAEIDLLQQLASQASVAIQQAELYHQSQLAATNAKAHAQQLATTLDDLQKIQTQLVQSEKMSSLGQLVAGVAHEINNPVNFITGNLLHASQYARDLLDLLELYQQQYPNPNPEILDMMEQIELEFIIEDLPKMLSSMQVGADRIRQIVLSLRNFSRIDQSEMKPVDIHEGIESTLMILHHRLKVKPDRPGIQVIKEYGQLPPVECYAGQLNQVFMNVLSNAIDALDDYDKQRPLSDIKANPSKIKINTSLVTAKLGPDNTTKYVRTVISDNGPGIPQTLQNRIFDPFFTTKEIGKGTGMGLSISRQIVVEKHGGLFKCLSQPNSGTEFWIEIPVRQQPLSSQSKVEAIL